MPRCHVGLAIVLALLAPILAGPLLAAAPTPDPIGRNQALKLVKAFLYQDFTLIEKDEYTTAVFADLQKNALEQLGLARDPRADVVRGIVLEDYEAHKDEYWVRAHMAQARTGRTGDQAHENWQKNLWDIFLSDPRYSARILAAIGKRLRLAELVDVSPALETNLADVKRVAMALAMALQERAKEDGCNSQPLTALPAVATEDPLLVTAIFGYFTRSDPSGRTVENALQALRSTGWSVKN